MACPTDQRITPLWPRAVQAHDIVSGQLVSRGHTMHPERGHAARCWPASVVQGDHVYCSRTGMYHQVLPLDAGVLLAVVTACEIQMPQNLGMLLPN